MSKLKTISKKVKVEQTLSTKNFEITYSYQHEQDGTPELVTARAVQISNEDTKLKIDMTWYPANSNLNITCHRTPETFNAALIDEIFGPVKEIMSQFTN